MRKGPIIQPRLVGQATTSPGRTSSWAQASVAALRGVTCVQGMALGSPATGIDSSEDRGPIALWMVLRNRASSLG